MSKKEFQIGQNKNINFDKLNSYDIFNLPQSSTKQDGNSESL